MNKSAAFEAGVAAAFEKEAIFRRLLQARKAAQAAKAAPKTAPGFGGHQRELARATAQKTDARGIVRQRVLDPKTGKYTTQRHIEL